MHRHDERHSIDRIGWLRAAVLGANDGIISTASLIVGVAAGTTTTHEIIMAGFAGLAAGSMSMAAGEYVSVSSQADTEAADLARERVELATHPEYETAELASIYVARGLDENLARQVAEQLMAKDALGAHLRDELGISDAVAAKPVLAAITSALTFAGGAALPLVVSIVAPSSRLPIIVSGVSLVGLAALGALGAKAGGAPVLRATLRVVGFGGAAMFVTALIGKLVGTVV